METLVDIARMGAVSSLWGVLRKNQTSCQIGRAGPTIGKPFLF